jgi:Amt family ammonium transporter
LSEPGPAERRRVRPPPGLAGEETDEQLAELTHAATHDVLTGLANRELLYERLDRALEARKENGLRMAVIFFDLDRFKRVNDSLGHRAGDELLVGASRRIEATVRPTDLVARFGGDEFVVVCGGLLGEIESIGIADRIRENLEEPFVIEGRSVYVSASLGVAYARDGSDAESLLSDADAAMFEAKRRGRGRTEIYDRRLRERAVERLETEAALRKALAEGGLHLVFQPVVELDNGSLQGLEALTRWDHPVRGPLPPEVFIRLAEDIGIIGQVGAWAVRQACQAQIEWDRLARAVGRRPVTTAINVSAHQLLRHELFTALRESLEDPQLDPSRIRLELTESAVIEDPQAGLSAMRDLKSLGVSLVLDDFGTGYASLSALRRFPIDTIKIDRSFVAGMVTNGQDRAIVSAVVRLGLDLGLEVVAEGVESTPQRDMLLELGCRLGQGYLYSRPLEHDQVRELLETT